MTVREIIPFLWKPFGEGSISIQWREHEYEIAYDSPILEVFGDYLVESVSAPYEYTYCIELKKRRPYMKEGDHEED